MNFHLSLGMSYPSKIFSEDLRTSFPIQAGFVSFSGRFCFKEAWVKRTDADTLETCSQQQHYKPLSMLDTAGKCLEKMHKSCL